MKKTITCYVTLKKSHVSFIVRSQLIFAKYSPHELTKLIKSAKKGRKHCALHILIHKFCLDPFKCTLDRNLFVRVSVQCQPEGAQAARPRRLRVLSKLKPCGSFCREKLNRFIERRIVSRMRLTNRYLISHWQSQQGENYAISSCTTLICNYN